MILQVLSLFFASVLAIRVPSRFRGVQLISYSKILEKCLGYFDHHPKSIQKQIMHHLKALMQSFQNQEKTGHGIMLRVAIPRSLKKHYIYQSSSGASQDKNTSSFKTFFKTKVEKLQSFLLGYITLPYLNWLRNDELSKL